MAGQTHLYGNGTPPNSLNSNQLQPYLYERKALIDARKEAYFGQLANVKAMPKNSGKEIRQYHYIPLLDDRNINDMGLDATGAVIADGNLYGSSKDVGKIISKLPMLSEVAGRANRVGFTRKEVRGSLQKYGFFTEYSEDLQNFDSDEDLLTHINTELLNGAMELTEDVLQKDLLNNAGTVRYTGTATQPSELAAGMDLTYSGLLKLSIALDNNRTPKQTTIITGTRMIDTKTLSACRVAYIGSELIPSLEAMVDLHNGKAFTPVAQYAAGTTPLIGEYGSIAGFRIVVVPKMLKWSGVGASASDANYFATSGKYDVFPFLVVGDESFTTIGFQTDGKTQKFTTYHRPTGEKAVDYNNPYGDVGIISIKWWYGFMALRPERIGLIKCVAKM